MKKVGNHSFFLCRVCLRDDLFRANSLQCSKMSKPCFGTHLFLKLVAALLRSLDSRDSNWINWVQCWWKSRAGKEHPWRKVVNLCEFEKPTGFSMVSSSTQLSSNIPSHQWNHQATRHPPRPPQRSRFQIGCPTACSPSEGRGPLLWRHQRNPPGMQWTWWIQKGC